MSRPRRSAGAGSWRSADCAGFLDVERAAATPAENPKRPLAILALCCSSADILCTAEGRVLLTGRFCQGFQAARHPQCSAPQVPVMLGLTLYPLSDHLDFFVAPVEEIEGRTSLSMKPPSTTADVMDSVTS